jgi:hypothetical protein
MARTLEQRLNAAELRAAKLRRDFQKAARKLDARRKIVIAGAVIAEARDDPAFEAHIKAIVRKRVTRPLDVAAVAEWLSTI